MTPTTNFELSIIIPALNEAATLPPLINALAKQQAIKFEVIVADGGSSDDTLTRGQEAADASGVLFQGIETPPGRATQMNAACRHARANDLLFLHADSAIDDPMLLANARSQIEQVRLESRNDQIAGHFGLRFIRTRKKYEHGYYFYEAKTTLNRRDCINGDQGFWLSKRFFDELCGFDESLDYMEDARLANKIFENGRWITLPGKLGTSARRFEMEGLKERQTLNALLCNFDRIGMHAFFDDAKQAYRQQGQTDTLDLGPFLKIIHRLSLAEGPQQALRYWLHTGGYVAENAWQLAYRRDCLRNRLAGHPPGFGPTGNLKFYDQCIEQLVTSLPGKVGAMLLTGLWFYCLLIKALVTSR